MNLARQQAVQFFIGKGWTLAQSAGIVANLEAESGLRPDAVGDGGAAYGIAQWHIDRQSRFVALIGKAIQGSSLDDQLAFVHAELQSSEKHAGDALSACTTAAEAGACVSKLYERPADTEGEAAKRAALAQQIFQDYGGATEAGGTPMPPPPKPSDVPATSPQPENPVGALLQFLPMILPLIPGLAGKIPVLTTPPTGPVVLPSGGSMHAQDYMNLIATIVQTFAGAVPGATGPGHAVDLAVANPAVAATAAAAVMTQPDVTAQLNAMIPVLDKVAGYDAQTNAAVIAGRASAVAAQQAATTGVVQTVVSNIMGQSWLMIIGVVVALIAAMVCKGFWPTIPDYVPMLIGPAGMIFGAVIAEMKAITAFFFDGTPASNATALARDTVEQDKANK